jgi:hypothetical protein
MRKKRQIDVGSRPPLYERVQLSKRLTPKERQALWLVASLFLIGVLVRWYRLAHPR